jgi:hypothetical protein
VVRARVNSAPLAENPKQSQIALEADDPKSVGHDYLRENPDPSDPEIAGS